MRKRYDIEFKRRIVKIIIGGVPAYQVANEHGISLKTIYTWVHENRLKLEGDEGTKVSSVYTARWVGDAN